MSHLHSHLPQLHEQDAILNIVISFSKTQRFSPSEYCWQLSLVDYLLELQTVPEMRLKTDSVLQKWIFHHPFQEWLEVTNWFVPHGQRWLRSDTINYQPYLSKKPLLKWAHSLGFFLEFVLLRFLLVFIAVLLFCFGFFLFFLLCSNFYKAKIKTESFYISGCSISNIKDIL